MRGDLTRDDKGIMNVIDEKCKRRMDSVYKIMRKSNYIVEEREKRKVFSNELNILNTLMI